MNLCWQDWNVYIIITIKKQVQNKTKMISDDIPQPETKRVKNKQKK